MNQTYCNSKQQFENDLKAFIEADDDELEEKMAKDDSSGHGKKKKQSADDYQNETNSQDEG